jgi:rhodanese-related sulfurtransferase
MIKQVSVSEAYGLQQHGSAYIDVRSTREFALGHPVGAVNVPILEPDATTGAMAPNADFVRVMQSTFPADARLLIGCQVGGRAVAAAQLLESVGFEDLTVVRGGYHGARDPLGRVTDPGWVNSDLPVAKRARAGETYRDLLSKADATK